MATPTTLPASFASGQILTATNMNDIRGAFRILQVVQGSTSTSATSTSTTFADTNLSATITPSATSSQVLILVAQQGCQKTSGNADNSIKMRLMRGSTEILKFAAAALRTGTTLENRGSISAVYLDSPATTSATTYKTQFANIVAASSVIVQDGAADSVSTIILCEVSA